MELNVPTDLPASLQAASAPLGDRIKYYGAANSDLIRGIHCGLMFILARWSSPARKAYPAFVRAIADRDLQKLLSVIVVDTDGVADRWQGFPQIQDIIGGWGEVVAIKNGKVLGTSGLGFAPEKYATMVESLVLACRESAP